MAAPGCILRRSSAVNPELQEVRMDITRREFAARPDGCGGRRHPAAGTPSARPPSTPAIFPRRSRRSRRRPMASRRSRTRSAMPGSPGPRARWRHGHRRHRDRAGLDACTTTRPWTGTRRSGPSRWCIPATGAPAWVCPAFEEAQGPGADPLRRRHPRLAGGRESVRARSPAS